MRVMLALAAVAALAPAAAWAGGFNPPPGPQHPGRCCMPHQPHPGNWRPHHPGNWKPQGHSFQGRSFASASASASASTSASASSGFKWGGCRGRC